MSSVLNGPICIWRHHFIKGNIEYSDSEYYSISESCDETIRRYDIFNKINRLLTNDGKEEISLKEIKYVLEFKKGAKGNSCSGYMLFNSSYLWFCFKKSKNKNKIDITAISRFKLENINSHIDHDFTIGCSPNNKRSILIHDNLKQQIKDIKLNEKLNEKLDLIVRKYYS